MKIIAVLVLSIVAVLGCGSKPDLPCPAGYRTVAEAEADEALARAADKAVRDGREKEIGAEVSCRGSRERMKFGVTYVKIMECILQTIPVSIAMGIPLTLSDCMISMSKMEYARTILGVPDGVSAEDFDVQTFNDIMREAKAAKCEETWRKVEVEADKHGLNKVGGLDFVPIIIWAIEAMSAPVTAPAMFMIKPGQGGAEQACVDVPADPPRRCSAAGDCPDRPPGAEPPGDTSGGVPVDPGLPLPDPGGDYP